MRPEVFGRPGLLVSLLGLALLAACSREPVTNNFDDTPAAATAAPKILLRGIGPGPDSLDPQKARLIEAHTVLRDLFECLTSLGPDASPVPGAASDWNVSDDGRVYTFKLRPELVWSNGDPLTAADFVAGLQRLVDPATASQYAQVVDVIENAGEIIAGRMAPAQLGVAAPDDATVAVTLTTRAPYLPGLLAHPSTCPVHRASLAAGAKELTRPGEMISNGAFTLEEWTEGSSIVLTRNQRYRANSRNLIDGVRYLILADENAELRAYRAGDLHVTFVVPRGQFDWIRENLRAELHVSPQLNTYFYGFNLDKPLFADNPKLRQALSMVIDRERLAKTVLRVGETPAHGWVPIGTHDYGSQSFDYAEQPMPERIAAARELYREAGFTAARPARFELRYNSGEMHNKVAIAVASMWKEALGVEAKLVAVEIKSLLADINSRKVDMFRLSWAGDYNDAYTYAQYLKSDFGINTVGYKSERYDQLLAKAAAAAGSTTRRQILEEAERLMLAEHPLIPLYFYVNKHLVKPEVRGWYDNVLNVTYSKDLALD
ncbi:MAG: peptide ABC transporter substrate-binding protein [Steroidobacteraceae bacterium]|nr:peptide ABC transporter substrate-binding protein [Steroidobacteraceae bacterium]